MCVGVPMQVIASSGMAATCRGPKGDQPVSLALTGPVEVGAYVLVFIDSAVRVLSADEAVSIRDALEAVDAATRGESFDHLIADLIDREPQLPDHLKASSAAEKEVQT